MDYEQDVLELLYSLLGELRRWPTWEEVDDQLDSRLGIDDPWDLAARVRRPLLYGIGDQEPHLDATIGLTLAGLARCANATSDLECFAESVRLIAKLARETRPPAQPCMTRADFVASLGPDPMWSQGQIDRVGQIWLTAGVPWSTFGPGSADDEHREWQVAVRRGEIRRFRSFENVAALLELVARPAAVAGDYPAAMPLDPGRAVAELKDLREQANTDAVQADTPEHQAWKSSVQAVMAAALPPTSTTLEEFRSIRYHMGVYTGAPGEAEEDRRFFASRVMRAAALIDSAVYQVELLADPSAGPVGPLPLDDGTVFVVHGHDDARKYELVRLLDRTTARGAQILHELPNRGATVIEKLELHAATASFAVVLLTADDRGGTTSSPDADLRPRARQNVVFEMGAFFGFLGRERVAVLYEEGVELPSDVAGLVYIPLDPAGAWRLAILKELEAAGIPVDRGKIP